MRIFDWLFGSLLAISLTGVAIAQPPPDTSTERTGRSTHGDAGSAESPRPGARNIVIPPTATFHRLALPDGALGYRAVVETMPIVQSTGDIGAQVAVISYMAESPGPRPVTFVFNGGPGASSAYLHLGALGPRILATGSDGGVPTPPPRLLDNPDSWLAFTDLVFIDPVGTGFSRATKSGEEGEKAFWSVSADRRSLSEVIRLWLTRNARWDSPKFIAGESYGGFRAAQIARGLLDQQGIALNGLVLLSPALEFGLIGPEAQNVLPWALLLPSMVASARAHGKGDTSMNPQAIEDFALTEYLVGIAAIAPTGAGPDPALIERVASLLGLDHELVARYHARVPAWVFAKRLLSGTGRSLSLYDGGQTGPDPRPGRPGPDPQLEATKAPFSAAYNAYVRNELNMSTDLPFRLLHDRPAQVWDWEGARGGPGREDGAADELSDVLALTPNLGLLVVHGRTDMVTPYMASAWLLDRLDLPADLRERTRLEVLDGGHMMYLRPDQRTALTRIARDFYFQQGRRP